MSATLGGIPGSCRSEFWLAVFVYSVVGFSGSRAGGRVVEGTREPSKVQQH
jgi:hypothetical protein